MMPRHLPACILLIAALGSGAYADSIFDIEGPGRDLIPAAGNSRAMGGAVLAGEDIISCSILSPFASALSDRITITGGFAHTGTKTTYLGEEKRTVTTLFPSVTVIIPFKGISFLTGLYQEKGGRLTLADTDTAYVIELLDVTFRKETSIHSVPVLASKALNSRLTLSAGLIVSFFDTRETTITDFRDEARTDPEDVHDLYATGPAFAGGILVDLGLARLAGFYRSKVDLDGTLESRNQYAGLYSSEDVALKSEQAFAVGALVRPTSYLILEADYHESPWDKLRLDERQITDKSVARWAVGARYHGNWLWRASKYPLIAGYYRQPINWESSTTGEITEEVFSVGTSIPIGQGRAAVSLSFEAGRRRAENTGEIDETMYGFSLSVSAAEAWRRAIRR
jgi:hypothetical protein